ncbi:MAG: polysaccharide deacetylase family protein [Solirubrobacteraceae bacterium]
MTIDNLGEAAELGSGTWPEDAPLGSHFTVGVVERLLELLGRNGVSATFFFESSNAEIYPNLLREIAREGHEIGCHAWRHESWSGLSPYAERELLERSTQALRALDLDPVGFRPPGGQVTPHTAGLLEELGYRYHSPAGLRAGVLGGLAVIPFEWQLVDAFFYAPSFAGLRMRYGSTPEPRSPDALRQAFADALRRNATAGEPTTLLFHPMLLAEEASFTAVARVLADVRGLVEGDVAECVTMRELADRMLGSPELFPEPLLDESTWESSSSA